MLQAVIYYIVTMILTKELVIATDQGGVYFTERNGNGTQVPEVNVCIHIY